jgi:hypothetical protein
VDVTPHRFWRRWFVWTTTGEAIGFALPAVVGATTWDAPAGWAMLALVAAGAVEGAVLGAAQAHVLVPACLALRRTAWVLATSAGAALAYVVGMAPSTLGDRLEEAPAWALAVLGGAGGLVLLASIGTAQWLVLRHALPRAAPWIPATALAWLAGLTVFLVVATPLWRAGQALWLTILVGVGAGLMMAATVAAVTGIAMVWLLSAGSRFDSDARPGR